MACLELGQPIEIFLYEIVDRSNTLSCFFVCRPRPEYGLPVVVIKIEF